jgi:DNA polymerase III delta prime subunit
MSRHFDNSGRDQFNFENFQGNFVVENREQPTRSRLEWIMLQEVEQEVASRLEQSLHNKVLINLSKQVHLEQVKRLWDTEVKIGSKPADPLSPETSILEVFERSEIAGQLLILGTPGAGKTTTILDLARSLIDKARQDSNYPIPVLFNLSSWKDSYQLIPTWLIEQLALRYGEDKKIFKKLIEEKKLLPMLDALDEVKPEHQESCVKSFNQWLQEGNRPLFVVVCSRWEEYTNYKTLLHLRGAILLKNLTDEQIQEYLSNVKQIKLWQLLQQDTELLELVRTPLLLGITVLSYEDLSLQRWQQLTSRKQKLKLLWDTYIQNRFNWRLESKTYGNLTPPGEKHTRSWLIFLAQQLQQESQTEFLIEKMQPSQLLTNKQKQAYLWVVRLIVGLFNGLIVGLFYRLSYGLIVGSIVGLFYGLFLKVSNEITLVEALRWSFNRARKNLFAFGLVGLLIFGLIGGLVGGLVYGLIVVEIDIKKSPNQGIQKTAINFLYLSLIGGLLFGLINGLLFGLFNGLINGLLFGLFFGLNSLGNIKELSDEDILRLSIDSPLELIGKTGFNNPVIQHLALRLILFRKGSIPWNYARFLNYCTERYFLQQVGGRYRFIHKQLQDHFAEMLIDTTVNE